MSATLLIILAVAACAGLLLWSLRGDEPSRLRQEYFHSVPLPRAQAEEALARHLAGLQQRYPGRSEIWYLRRILSDLERDRR
jgi:hypothetical protein